MLTLVGIYGVLSLSVAAAFVLSRVLRSFLFELDPRGSCHADRGWSAVRWRGAAGVLGARTPRGEDRSDQGIAVRLSIQAWRSLRNYSASLPEPLPRPY